MCVRICLLVINGGSSNICSFFLLAHDTQPVFFGSDTPQILAAKFSGSTLNVVTQWLPSFQHKQNQIIVFINSCRGDVPTHADSKDGACVTFVKVSLWTRIKSDSYIVRSGLAGYMRLTHKI